MDKHTEYELLRYEVLFLYNYAVKIYSKNNIEEVKMSTVKITKITTYTK